MLRLINSDLFLFLCQSANWQCTVCAEDEQSAATAAIEKIMDSSKGNDEKFSLAMALVVKKLPNDLLDADTDSDPVSYYSPVILADAGFHNEASNLHKILEQQMDKNNE